MPELPEGERPRDRLIQCGSQALSAAELLSIILRTGSGQKTVTHLASRLLTEFDGLPGIARASWAELQMVDGITQTKAVEIKAALELGRRLLAVAPDQRPLIKSSADAANLLMADMAFLEQEHIRAILLDTRQRLLKVCTVSIGHLSQSTFRVAELFREAIRENAASIIVAHNHPSGDATPSSQDKKVTEQLVEAGHLLGVQVLDHLVIGRNRFVSLREQGIGFDSSISDVY